MAKCLIYAQRERRRTLEQHRHITLCCRQIADFECNHAGTVQRKNQRNHVFAGVSVLNIVLSHTYGLIWKSLQPESPRESAPSWHQRVIMKAGDVDMRLRRGCRPWGRVSSQI
jgi:hypothetical protein